MGLGQLVSVFILIALVYIFADIAAGEHSDEIRRGEDISHLWGSRLRGVAMALPAFAFHSAEFTSADFYALAATVGRVALMWLMLCVEFWIVFDLRLNLRRPGIAWDYIGTDKETANADKTALKILFPFKHPGRVFFVLKAIAFAALLAACIFAQ